MAVELENDFQVGTGPNAFKRSDMPVGVARDIYFYGGKGDGKADDSLAFEKAKNNIKNMGGGRLYLGKGIFNLSQLDISYADYLSIVGMGPDVSIIRGTSPTLDIIVTASSGRWRRLKDITIDSSVTKTAGAHLKFIAEYRLKLDNLKLKDWFNGIVLESFEQCWLTDSQIAEPDGAGLALQIGKAAAAVQGSNFNIRDCFIRGTDGPDGVGGTAVGDTGVKIFDADSVFAVNVDIGGFINNDLAIFPQTRAGNHHFTQVFLDATKNGACLSIGGTGDKVEHTFTGCWFASAGQEAGGSNTAPGIEILNAGNYRKLQFNGGRVFNAKGIGVKYQAAGETQFNGIHIQNNGIGAVADQNHGFLIDTPLNQFSAHIHDCVFGGNNGDDVKATANSRFYTVQDCYIPGTFTNLGVAKRVSGNTTDPLKNTLASATTINLPGMGGEFFVITGTTNIGGISATWPGHRITLKFDNILTVVDNSQNLKLAGNFTTAAGSTLTLVCDGAEWYEVGRSVN